MSMIGEGEIIRAGCTAMDVHLRCTYPECACKKLPVGIRAAITAHLAALEAAGFVVVPAWAAGHVPEEEAIAAPPAQNGDEAKG